MPMPMYKHSGAPHFVSYFHAIKNLTEVYSTYTKNQLIGHGPEPENTEYTLTFFGSGIMSWCNHVTQTGIYLNSMHFRWKQMQSMWSALAPGTAAKCMSKPPVIQFEYFMRELWLQSNSMKTVAHNDLSLYEYIKEIDIFESIAKDITMRPYRLDF